MREEEMSRVREAMREEEKRVKEGRRGGEEMR